MNDSSDPPLSKQQREFSTSMKVDVTFNVAGNVVLIDHGYVLFCALEQVLGSLHGATWLGVHPLRGIARDAKELALSGHRSALTLRVEPAHIEKALELAGKSLRLGRDEILIGTSSIWQLRPAPVLWARQVLIKSAELAAAKDEDEADVFRVAVKRQLASLAVKARVELGRRRVMKIAEYKVFGYETILHDVSDDDSLRLQYAGIGGKRRMGAGVFVPSKRRKGVDDHGE
jgi:CRISPR-associated endonuclease/helicase Cas3